MADDFYNTELADAEQRALTYEHHERLDARAERDFDCHPDPKPLRREPRTMAGSIALRRARKEWREKVLSHDQDCCVHDDRSLCEPGWQGGLLDAHHVVPQQTLRQEYPAALWNPLSGMAVCGLAHRQHHNRVRPIRLKEIPAVARVFLAQQGYGAYLERHYPAAKDAPQ